MSKDKPGSDKEHYTKILKGITPAAGKPVIYQLTDDEGGSVDKNANGVPVRKVPAIIIRANSGRDLDPQRRLTVSLFILRPQRLGGPFVKDAVALDSGRDPGSWDTYKEGDNMEAGPGL